MKTGKADIVSRTYWDVAEFKPGILSSRPFPVLPYLAK